MSQVETFECRICSKNDLDCPSSFSNGFQYFDHMECHENPQLLRCDPCNKTFQSGIDARKHILKNHPLTFQEQMNLRQQLTGKYLTSEEILKKKYYDLALKVRLNKILTKILQSKKFSHRKNLKRSFKIAKQIEETLRLRRYGIILKKTQDCSLSCQTCRIKFLDVVKLKQHLNTKHTLDIPDFLDPHGLHQCPVSNCKMTFSNKLYLVTHLLRNHCDAFEKLYMDLTSSVPALKSNEFDCDENDFSWEENDVKSSKEISDREENNNVTTTVSNLLLKCEACHVLYETVGALLDHMKRLHSVSLQEYLDADGLNTCPWCWQKLGRNVEYHMQNYHSEELVQLLVDFGSCINEKTCSKTELVPVLKRKRDEKPLKYTCQLCDFIGSLTVLRRHFNNTHHLYEGNLLCPICKEFFSSSVSRNHHMVRLHSINWIDWIKADTKQRLLAGQNDFDYCCDCFMPLKPSQLDPHRQLYHSKKEISIKCHTCEEIFSTFEERSQHEKNFHSMNLIKFFTCDICGATISNKTRLRKHMTLHLARNESKNTFDGMHFFNCNDCSGKFWSNQALAIHRWKIHGEHFQQNSRKNQNLSKFKSGHMRSQVMPYVVEPQIEEATSSFTITRKSNERRLHKELLICERCGFTSNSYLILTRHQASIFCTYSSLKEY